MHRPDRDFTDAVCQPFLLQGEARNGKTHGILLLHGFTGTAAHMRPVGEALWRQGFTVMGINLPGHAMTMDDMAQCTWDNWLDAAKDAFLTLQQRCDYASVAGLSMGGCLALLIAEQMQPVATATISAPMGTRVPLWLTRVAGPFMKTVWWRQRDGNRTDEAFDYGYPGFRTVCGSQLERIIRISRQDLHAVTCPLLVVQSHADETIAENSAEVIMKGVSSDRRGVLWLDDAPHVCTISADHNRIADALGEHFRWAEIHVR